MRLQKPTLLVLTLLISMAGVPSLRSEDGIPINDPLTIQKCGGCHVRDEKGLMGRLSYIRTSPEVWVQAIKRMTRLHGLNAAPGEVREILRYLSSNNGLAPEEAKAGFWEVEHRTTGYQNDHLPDPVLHGTCTNCHNIGRVLAQRRTRDDYDKLVAMHIGLFPGSARTFRPRRSEPRPMSEAPARVFTSASGRAEIQPPRAPSAPRSDKYPVDLAIDYLAKAQPLVTPEWAAWRAAMRTPKLEGIWLIRAYQPGKGKLFGTMQLEPGSGPDSFVTKTSMIYAADPDTKLELAGSGIVYTGYSWRGRSIVPGAEPPSATTAKQIPAEWREAMMISRDGSSMKGRWFWSGFGELGIEVELFRLGGQPIVLGSSLSALRSPSQQEITIYGGAFPSGLKLEDFDFGPGITVTKVIRSTQSAATLAVEVAAGLPVGLRDISVGAASAVQAIAVYDKASHIVVVPAANISRLGGIRYPKEYAQFEALAFAAGPDGEAQTADDVPLGPVAATWSLEELFSTPDDDDIQYVGAIDDSGFFTPNVEGPNSMRKKQPNNFGVNNFGDVWVAASYATPDGRRLKARSYLVVTVPNYTLYDQPEVSE